ncbi:MAG: ankyrin repeat domain-containing protein [Vicinamibacterales bacterium]
MSGSDAALLKLFAVIASGDDANALRSLAETPSLSTTALSTGATRQQPNGYFFEAIRHGVYTGDTALHVAAAAYRRAVVEKLCDLGADVNARNRRGAEPLHYAVDGGPGSVSWNPTEQAQVIQRLLKEGANPNAVDKGGVTPLHRAVRNRCAEAVRVLLDGGADAHRQNKSGSTPIALATTTTGRGGTGTTAAKEQQALIVALLENHDDA